MVWHAGLHQCWVVLRVRDIYPSYSLTHKPETIYPLTHGFPKIQITGAST